MCGCSIRRMAHRPATARGSDTPRPSSSHAPKPICIGLRAHEGVTVLRQIVGNEIRVLPHESGKHLVARIGLDTEALLAAGGSEIFVVAGA